MFNNKTIYPQGDSVTERLEKTSDLIMQKVLLGSESLEYERLESGYRIHFKDSGKTALVVPQFTEEIEERLVVEDFDGFVSTISPIMHQLKDALRDFADEDVITPDAVARNIRNNTSRIYPEGKKDEDESIHYIISIMGAIVDDVGRESISYKRKEWDEILLLLAYHYSSSIAKGPKGESIEDLYLQKKAGENR